MEGVDCMAAVLKVYINAQLEPDCRHMRVDWRSNINIDIRRCVSLSAYGAGS